MSSRQEGYRVGIVGASSLLGKELASVLRGSKLPAAQLVPIEHEEEEPEPPILDLEEVRSDAAEAFIREHEAPVTELDFAFLAVRRRPAAARADSGGVPASLAPAAAQWGAGCYVIDLTGEGFGELSVADGEIEERPQHILSVPFLDRRFPAPAPAPGAPRIYVSAHPAVIVISSLLLRLAARFPLQRAVAQLLGSASESGARGIEELQKQTVNLLSFQKIPRQVFGGQLAFNLLPRLGRGGSGELSGLEIRLRQQLRQYLGDRVPLPALRLFQVPVFYSLGVSLYVETKQPVAPEAAAAALAGEPVTVRRASQDAPSPVEVTGSDDILIDSITGDAEHPTGIWIWAVADNIRLAAVNAVEIAESLAARVRS